ncbi:MAG: NnrS family protein, partial [Burkholderiaceae bacterium]|nr:NnrS family protein [Burkholderiaceae bacterium]
IEIAAYLLVHLAVVLRLLPMLAGTLAYLPWMIAAGGAWSLAFALYFAKYAPMLLAPRIDGRDG